MKIDAVLLGVRYGAGLISRESERRARYSHLADNREGGGEQTQTQIQPARYRAGTLHLISKVALRDKKGSTRVACVAFFHAQ